MTIQTYSDLQAAIARSIARADLAANIPDFIALFEPGSLAPWTSRRDELLDQVERLEAKTRG
jgi:hypothetical protein